ncbi:hypothetical protein D3C81_1547450 [compost metagenome]
MQRTRLVVTALLCATISFCFCGTAHADLFEADTFESCILKNMPGTANELAAQHIVATCVRKPVAKAGSGRGLLAKYPDGFDCFNAKGKSVAIPWAVSYVFAACQTLYSKPTVFDPSSAVIDPSRVVLDK